MLTFTISRTRFNALLVAAANDTDVRYYLRSIHVEPDRSFAEATNGHRLVRVPINVLDTEREQAIDHTRPWDVTTTDGTPLRKVPKKYAELHCTVEKVEGQWVMDIRSTHRNGDLHVRVTQIGDKYPNTDSVLPDPKDDGPLSIVRVNPGYLYDVPAALEANHIELTGKNEASPFRVAIGGEPEVVYVVMPKRA